MYDESEAFENDSSMFLAPIPWICKLRIEDVWKKGSEEDCTVRDARFGISDKIESLILEVSPGSAERGAVTN